MMYVGIVDGGKIFEVIVSIIQPCHILLVNVASQHKHERIFAGFDKSGRKAIEKERRAVLNGENASRD